MGRRGKCINSQRVMAGLISRVRAISMCFLVKLGRRIACLRDRCHRTLEREKKDAVPAGRTGEETAPRINSRIFVAFIFENAGRGVHASAGWEFPKANAALAKHRTKPADRRSP